MTQPETQGEIAYEEGVINALVERCELQENFIKDIACEYVHEGKHYLVSMKPCCRARRLLEEIEDG